MYAVFEALLFILVTIVCFYLPGKLLFSKLKLKLTFVEALFLPTAVGILIFTLTAYTLSWLQVSFLLLPLFVVVGLLSFRNNVYKAIEKTKISRFSLAFVLFCSLFFSLSMLVTGIYGDSIVYRRDDLWHLALINELKVHFPPDNPGIAEIPLRGYHFFYDFVVAQVSNISFISPTSLHFHLFPLLIAILWGFGVYALMLRWTGKNAAGLWGVFLTMLGGNFVYFLHFAGFTQYGLEDGLGIVQPAFSLYNPPLSISVIFILVALFSLHNYLATKKVAWLVPLTLSCGLVPMFKVYAGIILIAGLILLVLYDLMRKKFFSLVSLILTGLLFLGTFWIFVGGTGSLIYFPFWNRESVLRVLTWYGWDEKISTYTRLNVIRGLIETSAGGLLIFLVGNLGTRLIGILALPVLFYRKRKLPSEFARILLFMLIISILFPLFFIQSGKVYEIVQMATYYLFFAALFASFGFAVLFDLKFNKILKYALIIVIALATIPSAIPVVKSYFEKPEIQFSLSNDYFKAMQVLQEQGTYNDTVLEIPPRDTAPNKKSIRDWYGFSNPGIAAFSNKRTYLNNQYIEFPGVPFEQRLSLLERVITANKTGSLNEVDLQLRKANITYIYSTYELPVFEQSKYIKKIFNNATTVIYHVD